MSTKTAKRPAKPSNALFWAVFTAIVLVLAIASSFPWASLADAAPQAGRGPHSSYSQPTAWCSRCHQAHSGTTRKFLRGYWNRGGALGSGQANIEGTCFTCHDGTGAGTGQTSVYNIKAQFDKAYAMPITAAVEVHVGRAPTNSASYSGTTMDPIRATRHVECVDCHNPHVARQPNHMTSAPTNAASTKITGVWGVSVSYGVSTAFVNATTYDVVGPDLAKEWQLCFKCHTSYAWGTSTPDAPSFVLGNNVSASTYPSNDATELSKDFNPNNLSYHPVMTAGKNPFAAGGTSYDAQLRDMTTDSNGQLTPSSTIYCSDCHRKNASDTSNLNGPHGSTLPFILMGYWNYNICSTDDRGNCAAQSMTDFASDATYGNHPILCFNCHDPNTFQGANSNTGFATSGGSNLHDFHLNDRSRDTVSGNAITCMNCHSGVPHGSPRKRLLVTTSDPYPYRTARTRLKINDSWQTQTSRNYSESNCQNAMDQDDSYGSKCK